MIGNNIIEHTERLTALHAEQSERIANERAETDTNLHTTQKEDKDAKNTGSYIFACVLSFKDASTQFVLKSLQPFTFSKMRYFERRNSTFGRIKTTNKRHSKTV